MLKSFNTTQESGVAIAQPQKSCNLRLKMLRPLLEKASTDKPELQPALAGATTGSNRVEMVAAPLLLLQP